MVISHLLTGMHVDAPNSFEPWFNVCNWLGNGFVWQCQHVIIILYNLTILVGNQCSHPSVGVLRATSRWCEFSSFRVGLPPKLLRVSSCFIIILASTAFFFKIPFLWATCLWNYIMYSCLITDLSTLSLSSLPNIVCRFQSFRLQTSPLQLNVISISLPLWLQFPLPNWIEFPLFHNFLSYSPSFMFATFFAQNITSHEHTPTHVFFQIVFLDFSSNHSQIRRTPLHQMGCVPCF